MNVLVEFTALTLRRPGIDAGAEELAAWYMAKARLHEHIAEQGGTEAAAEAACATAAHEHARELLCQMARVHVCTVDSNLVGGTNSIHTSAADPAGQRRS